MYYGVVPDWAKALQELRDESGLTVRQLAKLMGTDHSQVSRRLTGATRIARSELKDWAAALGVTVDDIVKRAAPPPLGGIPVINRAPAGPAVDYASDHYDEYKTAWTYLDRGDINDSTAYAVEVVETSMEPTLHAGDLLILLPVTDERTRENLLTPGAIVLVRFSDDTATPGVTIARWRPRSDGSIMLAKDNPKAAPFIVDREAIVRLAVGCEVRRKL